MTLDKTKQFFVYALFGFSTFSIAGSDGAIIGLYFVSVLHWIRNPAELKSLPKTLWIPILGFVGLHVISGAVNPYEAGVLKALDSTWRFFLPLALYHALPLIDLPRLLKFFFVLLVLIAIYGIAQYFTGIDLFRSAERSAAAPYKHPCYSLYGYTGVFHAKGNYTHHLTYGGFLLLFAPLFFILSQAKQFSSAWRLRYLLGSVVIGVGLLASLARSIWLGSVAVAGVLTLRLPKRWLLAFACLGVVGVGSLLLHYTFKDQTLDQDVSGFGIIWQRLESGFVVKYNQDRLLLWHVGKQAIEDHFWFGIGIKNDKEVMPYYRNAIEALTLHSFFNSPGAGVHNMYLQYWLNLGLFGLLGYLTLWCFVFREGIHGLRQPHLSDFQKRLIWSCLAGLTGFLVAGLFENNFRDAEVQTGVLMLIGLLWYSVKGVSRGDAETQRV